MECLPYGKQILAYLNKNFTMIKLIKIQMKTKSYGLNFKRKIIIEIHLFTCILLYNDRYLI